jgi:hypothetical protein
MRSTRTNRSSAPLPSKRLAALGDRFVISTQVLGEFFVTVTRKITAPV